MSTDLPAALWPLVQRRRIEAAEPDPQALLIGADGCARVVSARVLADLGNICQILRSCGASVSLLPPLLDGSAYPVEFD